MQTIFGLTPVNANAFASNLPAGAEKQQPVPLILLTSSGQGRQIDQHYMCWEEFMQLGSLLRSSRRRGPDVGSFGIESDHMTVGGFIDELRSAR